ncbi:hypothetical protein KBC80_02590 [Candidatus Woesebacteria bacterium]|nr:hypothetical protein [Candidatus Woesebacteria bacterium]
MKNMREVVSNALVIGGLLTTGGSAVDAIKNTTLLAELNRHDANIEQMQHKYSIQVQCYPTGLFSGGSSVGAECFDDVIGVERGAREDQILKLYSDELAQLQAKNPINPRAKRDGAIGLLGLLIGAAGSLVPETKKRK